MTSALAICIALVVLNFYADLARVEITRAAKIGACVAGAILWLCLLDGPKSAPDDFRDICRKLTQPKP